MSSTRTQNKICAASPLPRIIQCSRFISGNAFVSRHICFKQNLPQIIALVAEWIDAYGINQWIIFRSSYRKSTWMGFKRNYIYLLYIYIYIYYRYRYIYIDIYICELVNLTRNKIKWITKKFIHPYYSLNSDSELAHWK